MSKRSWRNKDLEPPEVKPQRYSWKKHKVYSNYNDAADEKTKLVEDDKLVKIRRCGPNGSQFKVVIGKEINKKKKGEKNATK